MKPELKQLFDGFRPVYGAEIDLIESKLFLVTMMLDAISEVAGLDKDVLADLATKKADKIAAEAEAAGLAPWKYLAKQAEDEHLASQLGSTEETDRGTEDGS